MRMNAADTRASSAIADWTELTVVSRSWTTAEMDTFINEVSTTRTNIAIDSRMASRMFNGALVAGDAASSVIPATFGRADHHGTAMTSPASEPAQPVTADGRVVS